MLGENERNKWRKKKVGAFAQPGAHFKGSLEELCILQTEGSFVAALRTRRSNRIVMHAQP